MLNFLTCPFVQLILSLGLFAFHAYQWKKQGDAAALWLKFFTWFWAGFAAFDLLRVLHVL